MRAKTFCTVLRTEAVLYCRGFFGPFFSFAFPAMMIFLFGSIYGNDPTPFYGGRGAMDVSIPAYLGMVIAVSALMSQPLQLSEYQSGNVYKRFDATPAGKGTVIAAQLVLYLAAAALGSSLLVACGRLFYGIRVDGTAPVITAVFLLSLVSMFSIGFLIAAAFKSSKTVNLVSYLLYFLMLFLSGSTMPSELFPENVKAFARFLPLTHAVNLLKHSFAGAFAPEDTASVIVLAAVACVCSAAGAFLYRRRRWA